uniref:Uncharacterized protein n=1 Tax=Anguilla anguilla TaxID=7936 RepID=A0A0E9XIN0_ANGAN
MCSARQKHNDLPHRRAHDIPHFGSCEASVPSLPVDLLRSITFPCTFSGPHVAHTCDL